MRSEIDRKIQQLKCPVSATLEVIGGKWKPTIIYLISTGTYRFGELSRSVEGISKKVLATQLRELEADGIVQRKIYAEVPPKVEYSMTTFGATVLPIIQQMYDWGTTLK